MKSYKQTYQRLPAEFLEFMQGQYDTNQMDKILAGYMSQRPVTCRVNRLKTDVRTVMEVFRRDNIKFDRVLWYEDALIIRNRRERDLDDHPLYQEGHIYLQSLSSMIPPLALRPEPGQRVVDLTAAPGSKTTQLAAFMQNDGFILANEVNAIRAERLKFNLNRQGVSMAEVRVGDGKKLEDNWHEFFDSVLLDAPCSGVGIISMDSPQTYRGWSPRDVSKLAHEQKRLIESAVWALKPGGSMVYSTCTLTREENLDNVHWALDTFKGTLERQPIELKLTGVDNLDREGGIQLLPSSLYEGFFVAKFRKRG